jgi:ABC-type amino acid transport substrate-binding protein
MQAVLAVFTRLDVPLDPSGPEATQSRTLCIPESQPVPEEALAAVPWLKAANIKTLRPKTLIDCLAAADRRDADALIAIEPEARYAIDHLKLAQTLQIAQRLPVATGLHAIVAKDHPRRTEILQTISSAIAKLKTSGGYATVMTSHLADLTGAQVSQP